MATELGCDEKSNASETTYSLVPITDKEGEEVVHFLRKFYLRDEPLNAAIELLHESNDTCEEYEEYCIRCIPEGLSAKAVSSGGHLVGVSLSASYSRNHYNREQDLLKDCKNPKFKKLLQFFVTINQQSDIFGLYPSIENILEALVISVDEHYRGRGIARALLEKTKELAKERNFPLIKIDCLSHFTAKMASRCGFQCVSTFKYDYLDNRGKKIFNTAFPHTRQKTFVMVLKE